MEKIDDFNYECNLKISYTNTQFIYKSYIKYYMLVYVSAKAVN